MAETLPPLGAFGSFKGVMLCNRPPEPGAANSGPAGGAPAPFKSTISATVGEQLGLQPAKRPDDDASRAEMLVKIRGPSAALRRHCRWIKELQGQVKEEHRQAEEEAVSQQDRRARMAKSFKKQRDAIQRIKKECDVRDIDPAHVEAIIRPGGQSKMGSKGGGKPLWALTEEEREGVEDEDAALLIKFAQDLDYDKYIDDFEFRECLQVVKNRARHLKREQDAFKDAIVREFNAEDEDGAFDGISVADSGAGSLPRSRRAGSCGGDGCGPDGRPDWDGSTACGDERSQADKEAHSLAGHVLESNPQLRMLHSKGSVQRMMEQVQSTAPSVSGASGP